MFVTAVIDKLPIGTKPFSVLEVGKCTRRLAGTVRQPSSVKEKCVLEHMKEPDVYLDAALVPANHRSRLFLSLDDVSYIFDCDFEFALKEHIARNFMGSSEKVYKYLSGNQEGHLLGKSFFEIRRT